MSDPTPQPGQPESTDSDPASPAPDPRPRPQYGEYAPPGARPNDPPTVQSASQPVAQPGQPADWQVPYGQQAPFGQQVAPGYTPPFPEALTRKPKAPVAMWASLACWILAVLLVIGESTLLLVSGEAARTARDLMGSAAADMPGYQAGQAIGGLIGAMVPLIPLAFAIAMVAGAQSWARIVLCVLGGVRIFLSLPTLALLPGTGLSQVYALGAWLEVLAALLVIGGIVLMFLTPSSAYLREAQAFRRSRQFG